jgi:toxin FitB
MRLYDTSLLIYSFQPEFNFLQADLLQPDAYISAISKLEVLGYPSITQAEKKYFQHLFSLINVLSIEDNIINEAIDLRQTRKMSLGDALIAATAKVNNFHIYTRNTRDFQWISDLIVVNPMDIQ